MKKMKSLNVQIGMSILMVLMFFSCQKNVLTEPPLNVQNAKSDSTKTLSISTDSAKHTINLTNDVSINTTKAGSITVDYLKTFAAKAGDSDYFMLKTTTTWQIASYPSWVTVSPLSGTGNANVTVTVKENTGIQRTGEISISGIGISQNASINALQLAGTTAQGTLVVDYLKTFSSIAGDNDYFIITSNTTWKVAGSPSWLTVSPLSGVGNARVTVTVQANTGAQRSGSIIISGTGVSQNASINALQVAGSGVIPAPNETVYDFPFTSLGTTILNKKLVANSSVTGILLPFTNTNVDIENSYISGSNLGVTALMNIGGATSPKTVKLYNNIFEFTQLDNYTIKIGEETTGPTNNFYDNAEIIGNKLTGIGNIPVTGSTHGFFVSFSRNSIIKYNSVNNSIYGIINKSQYLDNSNGVIAYNLIKNSKYGVICKGIAGTNIYNNTFYSDNKKGSVFIAAYKHDDGGNGSTGTIIKNNIFYADGDINMIGIDDEASKVGFVSDYNVFYVTPGSPSLHFRVWMGSSIQFLSFAQWQALGYDTHSVVINPGLDPITLIPANAVQHAVNLGSAYSTGIDPSNTWNRNATVTKTQGATWQNGAFVK